MNKTSLKIAVVATSLVLGTSGLALAQQGLANRPASAEVNTELNAGSLTYDTGRGTTGYSQRSDREVPPAWQSNVRKPTQPLLPSTRE